MSALPHAAVGIGSLPLGVVLWPVFFGLGALLVLVAQPVGRPLPNLAERLRRLDVEARLRAEPPTGSGRRLFRSPVLEALLRPVVEDLGRMTEALARRAGVPTDELARRLAIARPGVTTAQFFGEKVASAFVGLAFLPAAEALGIHPLGPWPLWSWLVCMAAGFLLPDTQLDRTLRARRARGLAELPAILDMLTIACSAGLGLEQALQAVATESRRLVSDELRLVTRALALGSSTLEEALGETARRGGVPELARVAGQLVAAHARGLGLVPTLAAQAESLRERRRLAVVEQGARATVHMVLPVAVFILPVLFVVLLLPAVAEVAHLGG